MKIKATRLSDKIYYLRIKGQPDEINKVYSEVYEMITYKENIKRNLDEIFVFTISSMFAKDLSDYLLDKYKLITISKLSF